MIALAMLIFVHFATKYPPHQAEFYLPVSMCAVAVILQLGFIYDIRKHWDSMSPAKRDERAWQAVWVPPVVAWGSFIALFAAAVALAVWVFYTMSKDS